MYSLIIPVYRDLPGLRLTIQSIFRVFPDSLPEVIICNDGGCPQISRYLASLHRPVQEVVLTPRAGSYAARNRGIRQASGRYYAFIDAGVILADSWPEAIRAEIEAGSDYCGGCIEVYAEDESDPYQCFEMEFALRVEGYLREFRFCPTANLLVKAAVMEHLGIFDDRLYSSGDKEFGCRVYRAGYPQVYNPAMRVYHDARDRDALVVKSARILDGHQMLAQLYPEHFEPVTLLSELRDLLCFATGPKLHGRPLTHISRLSALRVRCALTWIKLRQLLAYNRQPAPSRLVPDAGQGLASVVLKGRLNHGAVPGPAAHQGDAAVKG